MVNTPITSDATATLTAPAVTIQRAPTRSVTAGVRGMTRKFTATIGPDVAMAASSGE